ARFDAERVAELCNYATVKAPVPSETSVAGGAKNGGKHGGKNALYVVARRIREKEGLSYSVGSWLSASSQDEAGEFGVYAIYAPQNRARVQAAIAEELRRALDEGFAVQEVEDGRRSLLHARKMARNSDSGLARGLAGYSAIDRTLAWDIAFEKRIAELTPAQVRDALHRHLQLGKLSVVKAGDFKPATAKASAAQK
ncbi:MAG: insulinase family protein, partial [Chloroflexi bacterium]|nr:insulinase family protein [Chloroflexota bacterium]